MLSFKNSQTLWRRKKNPDAMAAEEVHHLQDLDQPESMPKEPFQFRKHIIFILAIVALLTVLLPLAYRRFTHVYYDPESGIAFLRPNATSPYFKLYNLSTSAPHLYVDVSITMIDPLKKTYTVQAFTFFNNVTVWIRSKLDPNATVCMKPFGSPAECTTYVSRMSSAADSAPWKEGLSIRVDAAFAAAENPKFGLAESSLAFYPFDRYSGAFGISAFDAPSEIYDKTGNPPTTPYRPFTYSFLADIQGFVTEIDFQYWEQYGAIEAKFVVHRSTMTIAFSILVMLFMWTLVILEATALFDVITRKRNHEGPMLGLSIGAIFALPGIRNAQPGVPPFIGCVSDIMSYYWCMPMAITTCIIALCNFVLRHKHTEEEKEKAGKEENKCGDCCKCKCTCHGEPENEKKTSMGTGENGEGWGNIYAMNIQNACTNGPGDGCMDGQNNTQENLLPEYRSNLGEKEAEEVGWGPIPRRAPVGQRWGKSLPSSYV